MHSLPYILQILRDEKKIADEETRIDFEEKVVANPTWFIWALRDGQPTKWPGPTDFKRMAFIHVPNVSTYFDALSNVAGIRQFDTLKSSYCAVDLLAYHRAKRQGLLQIPRPSIFRSAVATASLVNTSALLSQTNFTLIDFLPLVRVEERSPARAFVWFSPMLLDAAERENAWLSDAGFVEGDAPKTKNLRRVRMLSHPGDQFYEDLNRRLLAYGAAHPESGIENWLPEQSFKRSERGVLEEALKELAQLSEFDWDQEAKPDPAAPSPALGDPGDKNRLWLESIGMESAWSIVAKRLGIDWHERASGDRPVVAILDTAINYDHPALVAAWSNSGDATPEDSHSLADQLSISMHGTACAGLAVGRITPGGGKFRGIGAGCRLLGARVWAGSNDTSYYFPRTQEFPWMNMNLCPPGNLAEAIETAHFVGGARVLSLSLQYNQASVTPGMEQIGNAIRRVIAHDCVVVLAAGNTKRGDRPSLLFPASLAVDGLIVVAASARGQLLLTDTCCQECVPPSEVFPGPEPAAIPLLDAPPNCLRPFCDKCKRRFARPDGCPGSRHGENVTLAAPGVGLWTTDVQDFGSIALGGGKWDYAEFCATSGATPIVAGVAALMRAVNPDLKAAEVKEILRATALTRPMWDASIGTPAQARRLPFGLLNAEAALTKAAARPGALPPIS